jgi:hypothetical protein
VQELVLLQAIEECLQGDQRTLMQRFSAAWRDGRLACYQSSVDALAQSMARLTAARQELADAPGLRAGMRKLGAALGLLWLAHIGMDRAFGFGLKYPDSFRHTHLGVIGRPSNNT